MGRNRKSLGLKYVSVTAAVAVALLTASTVQAAAAASSRPVTHEARAAELGSAQTQPMGSGKSYFWSDVAITGGVLAGIVVLGLWGDVVVGGTILGIQLLCAGAAIAARKVKAAGRAPQRAEQVIKSNPAASSR